MASKFIYGTAAALILALASPVALAEDPSSATGANQQLQPDYQADSQEQTLGASEMEQDCLASAEDTLDSGETITGTGETVEGMPATKHQEQVLSEEEQAAAMEPAAGCGDTTGPDSVNPTQMEDDENPSSETGANQ